MNMLLLNAITSGEKLDRMIDSLLRHGEALGWTLIKAVAVLSLVVC